MADFKTRLLTERDELAGRLAKLNDFIVTDQFNNIDEAQQALLIVQSSAMATYLSVLNQRLYIL